MQQIPGLPLPRPQLRRVVLLCAGLASCAADQERSAIGEGPQDAGPSMVPTVGEDTTLDVITWNLKQFPLAGSTTVQQLAAWIPRLRVDILAVQEIRDAGSLRALAEALPSWGYQIGQTHSGSGPNVADSNAPVAFLYDTRSISVVHAETLFPNDVLPFPRPPLALYVQWLGTPVVLVNVHLKAMGDGLIDPTNEWDEERRRSLACELLAELLHDRFTDDAVIVLGDFNDRLEEPKATNVFLPLLRHPERFRFIDEVLVRDPRVDNVSYPSFASHIDHLLVTNELFEPFFSAGARVGALQLENALSGGLAEFQRSVSDHRPVYARFVWTWTPP